MASPSVCTSEATVTDDLPGLDAGAVTAWLEANVARAKAPVRFSLIAGGHSNLTFEAADAAGNEYVVRRGPLGVSTGGAHNMGREFRILTALAGSVPVPRALGLCEDPGVTGAEFYVMERVGGAVIDDPEAADADLPDPVARHRAGEQLVDTLADLHRVDIDAVGLGDMARRVDFLARQVHRFAGMWERTRTRDLPAMDRLVEQLRAVAPPQQATGIVHGDYRIGNVMIDRTGALTAVLDWELWTLGDVLADVAFMLNNWVEPDDPEPAVFMATPPTVTGEFGSRADALDRYASRTGFDVFAIDYHRAFQHWRMAVIAEGVKRRYESAQMGGSEVDFDYLERRVVDLVELAGSYLARYEAGREPG